MIETPDYDRMVTECGDPAPVFDELAAALDTAPPDIDEAHGVVDAGELDPVQDPGPSAEFAAEPSTPHAYGSNDEPDEVDEVDDTPSPDTDTGNADA